MTDREILRALAQRYAEAAQSPENAERRARAYSNNALRAARPLVWIDEVPWHEMDVDGQLVLHCTDPMARNFEAYFRRKLFQWDHFRADMILESEYPIGKAYEDSGIGVEVKEDCLETDPRNGIRSHRYRDLLADRGMLSLLRDPVITARPDVDLAVRTRAEELFGDLVPTKLCGHSMYHAPWDTITTLRGLENCLCDMKDDPEFVHETVRRFYEIAEKRVDQMNALGLFGCSEPTLHCTPAYCAELEQKADSGADGTSASSWYRSMAQSFSSVSPAMHGEFDIDYAARLAKRFGLSYYGCCEPLSDRLDVIRRIPNLRKIGVSAWSDQEVSAEAIGDRYVFSRKPNPAQVAVNVDEEQVRRDIGETARLCIKYGCPCDITLKDISTVSYRPGNLFAWARIAEETLDRWYGR